MREVGDNVGAQHIDRHRVKGSTIIISVMFAAVVAYVALDVWLYLTAYMFLPSDVTYIVGACFVGETVALAKLKIAKEQGNAAPAKRPNQFMQGLGLYDLDTLDEGAETGETTNAKG